MIKALSMSWLRRVFSFSIERQNLSPSEARAMTSHHELQPMNSRQNTPRSTEDGRTPPVGFVLLTQMALIVTLGTSDPGE